MLRPMGKGAGETSGQHWPHVASLAAQWQDAFAAMRSGCADVIHVEGVECVRWLLHSQIQVEVVVGKATALAALAEGLSAAQAVHMGSKAELADLVGFSFDRGVLALARRPQQPAFTATQGAWLFLDAVHDPSNVGSLIRSARCLGMDGVVIGAGSADPYYRRAVRVSVGHVFHMPLQWSHEPEADCLRWQQQGGVVLAAHRGPASQALDSLPAVQQPYLLLMGNEDRGVTPALAACADHRLEIPVLAGTDSLNVAVAGGILMHALQGKSHL